MKELGYSQEGSTTIMYDHSSTIKLSKNPVMHGRRLGSKHNDVCFHFLRDLTKDGEVELVHGKTRDRLADLMTKPLKSDAFQKLRGRD